MASQHRERKSEVQRGGESERGEHLVARPVNEALQVVASRAVQVPDVVDTEHER